MHDSGLLRVAAALNRTVAPLLPGRGRRRAPFLDELPPPPRRGDGAFDADCLPPWAAMARRAIAKASRVPPAGPGRAGPGRAFDALGDLLGRCLAGV